LPCGASAHPTLRISRQVLAERELDVESEPIEDEVVRLDAHVGLHERNLVGADANQRRNIGRAEDVDAYVRFVDLRLLRRALIAVEGFPVPCLDPLRGPPGNFVTK
jgi:hypothetical protein